MRLVRCLAAAGGIWLLMPSNSAQAQSPVTPYDKQYQWFAYSGDHPVTKKFALHLDGGIRLMSQTPWQQYQVRPGVNYQVSRRITIGAAYAYFKSHPDGIGFDRISAPEHRMHQQISISQTPKHLVLRHRFRIEERFLGSAFQPIAERNWKLQTRVRYQARLDIPLYRVKGDRTLFFLALSDEVHLRYQPTAVSGFDQNRASAGIGWRPTRFEAIEVAMFNQRFRPSMGGRLENNNVLFVTVSSAVPLRRMFNRREN